MIEEIKKKIFGNINYDTYMKVEKISACTIFATYLINNFDVLDPISTEISYLNLMAFINYMTLATSGSEKYTKDVSVVRELYNTFIDNYVKLNKEFNFNNPVEIYSMYDFMLRGGYLSNSHTYKFSKPIYYDIKALRGVPVITGGGVCRHISSILDDIFKVQDINSIRLSCRISESDELKLLKRCKTLLQKTKYEKSHMRILNKSILEIQKGEKFNIQNHSINYAQWSDLCCFFDATNREIYLPKDDKTLTSYKDEITLILNNRTSWSLKQRTQFKKMQDLNIENVLKELREKISLTQNLCEENIDILERFYLENSELYKEITDKYSIIKKLKIDKKKA